MVSGRLQPRRVIRLARLSCVGDAVAALKPVISLQNTSVDNIPSRRYGVATP